MTLPSSDQILGPLLTFIAQQGETSRQTAIEAVAMAFELTQDERVAPTAHGQPRIAVRAGHALQVLERADLIDQVHPDVWRSTAAGFELIAMDPPAITLESLRKLVGTTVLPHSLAINAIDDPQAVQDAIAEFDRLTPDTFLTTYGFGKATRWYIDYRGNRYDTKAIIGVAHKYQFGEPLRPRDFYGGDPTNKVLVDLGFDVVNADDEVHPSQGPWSANEIATVVTEYMAMLTAETVGEAYIKTQHNKRVADATGRSRGSVEFKFANISAVMQDLGLPYVKGYLPRENYQQDLLAEVRARLDGDTATLTKLEKAPPPEIPATAALTEVPVPPGSAHVAKAPKFASVGTPDYGVVQAENRRLGLRGEQLVVAHERAILTKAGRADLAAKVVHTSVTIGDGKGFDVASFTIDGRQRHIEVKTTSGGSLTPFYLSAAERAFALLNTETFAIYRVFELGAEPKFFLLAGAIEDLVDLEPVTYRARLKPAIATPPLGPPSA